MRHNLDVSRLSTAKKLTLCISSTREAEVHDDREAVLREGQLMLFLFYMQVQSELRLRAPTFHVAITWTWPHRSCKVLLPALAFSHPGTEYRNGWMDGWIDGWMYGYVYVHTHTQTVSIYEAALRSCLLFGTTSSCMDLISATYEAFWCAVPHITPCCQPNQSSAWFWLPSW